MHGLIFETSIWLLAGSTRFVMIIQILPVSQVRHELIIDELLSYWQTPSPKGLCLMNFLHHLSNPHYYELHCHVQEHIQSKANTRTMSKSTHQEIHHTLHICPYIPRNTFCDKAMQQHTTCQTKFSSIFNFISKSLSINQYLFQSCLSSCRPIHIWSFINCSLILLHPTPQFRVQFQNFASKFVANFKNSFGLDVWKTINCYCFALKMTIFAQKMHSNSLANRHLS